jgi:hypothetical protein
VHDWARRQPIAPVFTSEYLAIVEGFRTARIARVPGGWRIWNHGALRTVRFDATKAAVDLARSQGVLGFSHHQGSLYVHLASSDEALVALADQPAPVLYLVQASHRVTAWSRKGNTLAFHLAGVGAKTAEIGGLPAGYQATVEITEAGNTRRLRAQAGPAGRLAIAAGETPEVRIRVT